MNAIASGASRARPRLRPISDGRTRRSDAAWLVLEAANDLGDHATVEICRRVIDASLNGRPPSPSDLHVVLRLFQLISRPRLTPSCKAGCKSSFSGHIGRRTA